MGLSLLFVTLLTTPKKGYVMPRFSSLLVALVTLAVAAGSASGLETQEWIAARLSVGARITHFEFTDGEEQMFDESGQFIGGFTEGISIDQLDEIHNYNPLIYGRYRFTKYFSVEVAQERIRGDARSYYGHTDGELDVKGVSLQALLTASRASRFQPYAGLGVAYLDCEFDHAPWGYGVHIIDTESDTIGYLATLGCTATVWRRLSIDGELRYLVADVDSHFHFVPNRSHFYWTFPIDNWAAQVGAKWTF